MRVRFPPGALGVLHNGGYMNNILEKAKEVLSHLGKYKRYICVCGLFVVSVLVLYFFTGEEFVANRIAKMNSQQVSGEDYVPDKEFGINAYEELNELINTYFEAYVNADFDALSEIATPITDMEKSYITTLSNYYEEYQDVVCYTKHGLSKDSFIVSACFNIKFVDLDVVAPSMVLFYVQTNEAGELYINNLYSDFNMQYSELAINRDVFTALRKYTTQDDYLELYNNVETAFNQLIKENEEVYVLTKRIIPAIRQEWEDNVYYFHDDETEEESTDVTEETETESDTELSSSEAVDSSTQTTENTQNSESTENSETQEPESVEPVVQKVKVKSNNTNVRSEANAGSTKLGQVDKGTILVKLGVEGDWTKVEYDDQIGYIKTSLLEAVTE